MKVLIIILTFLISTKAFSCECGNSNFVSDTAYSKFIFSGLIISKENNISKNQDKLFYPPMKYRIVIKDKWKGELNDTIDLYSGLGGPDCGFDFEINKSYIVWAIIDRYGLLYTSRCGRTCLLNGSPDIDLLNNKFKGLAYDSTNLTNNEISVLKKKINVNTTDLSKTALFLSKDKLLSKTELIDAIINPNSIEFITFPKDKLKLLPDRAKNGALIVKDYNKQKIKVNKIIKIIKKPSR
jgi:hypothetical protein